MAQGLLLTLFALSSWCWRATCLVPQKSSFAPHRLRQSRYLLRSAVLDEPATDTSKTANDRPKIVLVAGFESFNRELYQSAHDLDLDVTVFADSDIRIASNATSMDPNDLRINPEFEKAVREADAFVGSLIFDYDDVLAVRSLLGDIKGPRLIFESATELMEFNSVGSFSMKPGKEGPSGPPPAVKAVLSKFGSGKEEDKLAGYLKLLKVGPDLLKLIPGDKASDLYVLLYLFVLFSLH